MDNHNIKQRPLFIEALILELDKGVPGAAYRIAIGFLSVPTMSWLFGDRETGWGLSLFLVVVLVLLRLVPAIIRKIAPFSQAVKEIWAARRQLAKRHDSYQWKKLLWIGFGLGLYTVNAGQWLPSRALLSMFCLGGGLIGLLRWRAVGPRE